ncbi:MAG: cytochrome c, partial [Cyclobacteriaceae bacterium]|nr:cytochrome c [Cyclobacteriaceae bacterium HetDA_MAG_MS6]
DLAAKLLVNPLDSTADVVKAGKELYGRFCEHCHGKEGLGDGKVGQVYKGVTAYTSASVVDKPGGHIYHVITNGKGRMGAHASQISSEDRWKIVRYVQVLQKQ